MIPAWLQVIGFSALLFGAAIFTSYIREDYDAERWETDPDYCRYGASLKEVFKWWWHRK